MQRYIFSMTYTSFFLKINISLTFQLYNIKNVNFEKIIKEKFAYVLEIDYLCSGKEYFSRVRRKTHTKK